MYEGPAAAGGDDVPVPPAVIDGFAVAGVKMGPSLSTRAPWPETAR